jgi:hypothetical protein
LKCRIFSCYCFCCTELPQLLALLYHDAMLFGVCSRVALPVQLLSQARCAKGLCLAPTWLRTLFCSASCSLRSCTNCF